MKKLLFIAVIAALTVPALAVPTVTMTGVTGSDGATATFSGGALGGLSIYTFCVEGGYVAPISVSNNIPYEYTIDDVVKYGGYATGNPAPAALFDHTKKLYAAYLNASLGLSAAATQDAIWAAQTINPHAPTDAILLGKDISGWTDVRVLNLWEAGDDKADVQSFLIRVPAPGAFLLGGLGVACVGWIKRRRML